MFHPAGIKLLTEDQLRFSSIQNRLAHTHANRKQLDNVFI